MDLSGISIFNCLLDSRHVYIYTYNIIHEYDNNDNLVILIMMIMIAVISILCMYKYIHSIFKIVETRMT